jgi:hypothetical protein
LVIVQTTSLLWVTGTAASEVPLPSATVEPVPLPSLQTIAVV